MVLFDAREVLFALGVNTGFEVFLDPIVANDGVGAQVVLRHNVDAVLAVLSDLVHHDLGVGRDGLHAHLALGDLAQLNLSARASLNFDARSLNVIDDAAQDLRL